MVILLSALLVMSLLLLLISDFIAMTNSSVSYKIQEKFGIPYNTLSWIIFFGTLIPFINILITTLFICIVVSNLYN